MNENFHLHQNSNNPLRDDMRSDGDEALTRPQGKGGHLRGWRLQVFNFSYALPKDCNPASV